MLHTVFRNSIKSVTSKFYAAQLLTDKVKRKCLEGNDKVEIPGVQPPGQNVLGQLDLRYDHTNLGEGERSVLHRGKTGEAK